MSRDWRPISQKQIDMISSPAFEVLCGGARGGTKSESGLGWLALVAGVKNFEALVLRKSATDLKKWVRRAREFFRPLGGIVTGSPATVRFPGGGVIETGHMDNMSAIEKYQGGNYLRILIEEVQLIPEENMYEALLGALRSTTAGVPAQVMVNANPGGAGHSWIKDRWRIEGKPPYSDEIFVGENGRTRQFVFSTIKDNPVLRSIDPEYEMMLKNMKDRNLAKAWHEGDWSVFSGQFFSTFSPQHHGMDAFKIPESWPIWAGLDYGTKNPTAFALYTKDTASGRVIRVCEYYRGETDYGVRPTAETHAKGIKEMVDAMRDTIDVDLARIKVYADPSMWRKEALMEDWRKVDVFQRSKITQVSSESAADIFRLYGINVVKATNDRIFGWRVCQELLGYREGIEPDFGYFRQYNKNFEKYIPQQQYEKDGVDGLSKEDLRKCNTDHIADEMRYALTGGAGANYDNSLGYPDITGTFERSRNTLRMDF